MVGTIHQTLALVYFGYAAEAEKPDWKEGKISTSTSGKDHNLNSRPGPRHPYLQCRATRSSSPMRRRDELEALRRRDRCHGKLQADVFLAALKTCTQNKDLAEGISIHDEILKRGLLEKCSNAVVIMYAKCGELGKAKDLLDMHKSSSNVVAWTALIDGYAREGHGQLALDCFEQMKQVGILPDAVTYICILKACAAIGAADKGKQIHGEVERQGLLRDNIVLGNALVDMYAKCGAVSKARRVFDRLPSRDVVSWNALISGYAQGGYAEQALNSFEEMEKESISPDAVTYACVLKACATIGLSDKGEQIHDKITSRGLLRHNVVLGNALVDMYAKCGALQKARHVLDGLPHRDVVSWNALIAGYVQDGHAERALDCFEEMKHDAILPNEGTYSCILKACATIRAADKGEQFHEEIERQGFLQNNVVLGGALVDMYAKSGAILKARQVLDRLPSRDVVTWSALIGGYAQEGDAEQALKCFEDMQHEGIRPNAVTCACVLNVCSHRGLVEEGQEVFVNMNAKYGVNPSLDCYICMVDLLGRAGHLEKAVRLIQDMPSADYPIIWHTLLGACYKWLDVNVGRWAFERAVDWDKSDGPAYVLMANIYATVGMRQEAGSIEAMRIRNRAWKKPVRSVWIEPCNVIH